MAREYQENKGLGKNLQGCTLSLEPLIKQGRPGRGNELSSDYGKKYSMSALWTWPSCYCSSTRCSTERNLVPNCLIPAGSFGQFLGTISNHYPTDPFLQFFLHMSVIFPQVIYLQPLTRASTYLTEVSFRRKEAIWSCTTQHPFLMKGDLAQCSEIKASCLF